MWQLHSLHRILLTTLFLVVGTSAAIAVDLINRDSGGYEVRVTPKGGNPIDISIDGLSQRTICNNACKIEVKGVGTGWANADDTFVIENGTLKKQS